MEQTTLSQSVNFLGFLRGQLNGLQGIPTLCYELIQNADDVRDNEGNPAASRITFDICDDALYIENDGVFREIDFERMRSISWGNKREEADTTGAFGIGFISVYQITDSPEIFSSGQHWKFCPDASEDKRIVVDQVETQHTRFRLPWAFEASTVRKELMYPPVEKSQLDEFAKEMSEVIEIAALFLKQINSMEVKRSGETIRRIQTYKENDWLLIEDGKQLVRWRILDGDFAIQAREMRNKHISLIEEKRKSLVTIAIPEVVFDKGLLYAFLPSETRTGLPFHINADFYPSPDRKRILLEAGYKSEWNNAAVECAAKTFAIQIDKVLEIFTPDKFWAVAERIESVSKTNTLSPAFTRFWHELKTQLSIKDTILTVGGKILPPNKTHYPSTKDQYEASKTFEELGLSIVDPSLSRYQNLITDKEIGVQILKYTTVARALKDSGFTNRIVLADIVQPSLRNQDGWNAFLTSLNDLRNRSSVQERADGDNQLKLCSIAFGEDGAIWPPALLFKSSQDTQKLFSNFSIIAWFSGEENQNLPSILVSHFGLKEGVTIIEQNESFLPELWSSGKYSPQKIYEWFELFQNEIRNNLTIRETIRKMQIWPSAEGKLKSLKGLYLTGDFKDPLNLAQLVDVNALGGRHEFLENILHVEKLDFVTYIREWIPSVIRENKLTIENRLGLIQVMSEYLGKLQGQTELQKRLSKIPLVWCGNSYFLPADEVCFDTQNVRDVLGAQFPTAVLPSQQTESVRALYEWLGVAHEPRPVDIVARIKDLISSAPQNANLHSIEKIFAYLANHWSGWDEGTHHEFSLLKKEKWLPGTKNPGLWFDASSVFSIYSSHLFESQGNFLKIDRPIQQKGSELMKFLNIESEPSTEQVVKHLLYMSDQGKAVNQEIYVFLNRFSKDAAISLLRNKPCLYLKAEKGEIYFRPDQVFWEEHPFGYFRSRLGPEFGRFKDLFDSLQVKSKPDAGDAIKVLLEISEEFGSSNTPLMDNKEVEDVVIMCWQILTTALEAGIIDSDMIQRELGNKKTIPDSRHILSKPITLLFEDRPGWGSKFEIVKNSLIPRIEKAWGAMEAAGVQRISKAVTIEIHQCENPRENEDMKKRLLERKHLIQRVIESHRAKGVTDFELENLESLYFTQSDRIEIVRTFKGFNRVEPASLEKVDAIFLNDSLYFSSETDTPWISIARELAYVLHPSGELSSLGMELKEILSQPSFDAANSVLDEYGYPRIAVAIITPVGSQEIIGLGGKEGINNTNIPESRGSESDNEGDTDVPGDSKSTTGSSASPKGKKLTNQSDNRKSSRLVSYVVPKNPNSDHGYPDPNSEWATRRSQIGKIGVERVMEYERSQGRDPIDMETIQVNHPGYDITSVDESKKPRYIEVKSFTGIWDSQNPAQMTKKEFETAREKGDTFWLYVVENAESENFQIHCICNPAQQVDAYLFDHGWLNLSINK